MCWHNSHANCLTIGSDFGRIDRYCSKPLLIRRITVAVAISARAGRPSDTPVVEDWHDPVEAIEVRPSYFSSSHCTRSGVNVSLPTIFLQDPLPHENHKKNSAKRLGKTILNEKSSTPNDAKRRVKRAR